MNKWFYGVKIFKKPLDLRNYQGKNRGTGNAALTLQA